MTEYEIKIKKVMDITNSVVDAFRKGHMSAAMLGDITDILDEYTDLIEETSTEAGMHEKMEYNVFPKFI
jgi:hypothetical protein